jgi:hypothetical protein
MTQQIVLVLVALLFLGTCVYVLFFRRDYAAEAYVRECEKKSKRPKGETETIWHPDNATLISVPKKEHIDCTYCKERHHPYQPCTATERTICQNCGESGHFECFYD